MSKSNARSDTSDESFRIKPDDVLSVLTEDGWRYSVKRAKLYTGLLLRQRGIENFEPVADEIVHESIVRFLLGTRKWNRRFEDVDSQLAVKFTGFLCGVCRSLISDMLQKKSKRIRDIKISDLVDGLAEDEPASGFEVVLNNTDNPIIDYLDHKFWLSVFEKDEGAQRFITAVFEGFDPKPAYIAVTLGLSVKEVYNIKKRILRGIKKVPVIISRNPRHSLNRFMPRSRRTGDNPEGDGSSGLPSP